MCIRISRNLCFFQLFLLVLFLFIVGCSPSVRYTRDSSLPEKGEFESQLTPDSLNSVPIQDNRLLEVITSYIGTPYRYGGLDRRGLDCSGFVYCVFRDALNVSLPHNSFEMHKLGKPVSVHRARQGDLIFFRGRRRRIDHVGIYLGEERFVHASTNRGVVYSDLTQEYYRRNFAEIRRIYK